MAIVILFVAFHLKSTLLSDEYSKNFLILRYDFVLYMSGDWANYYYQKGGDKLGAYQIMGEEVNNAGIRHDNRLRACMALRLQVRQR